MPINIVQRLHHAMDSILTPEPCNPSPLAHINPSLSQLHFYRTSLCGSCPFRMFTRPSWVQRCSRWPELDQTPASDMARKHAYATTGMQGRELRITDEMTRRAISERFFIYPRLTCHKPCALFDESHQTGAKPHMEPSKEAPALHWAFIYEYK